MIWTPLAELRIISIGHDAGGIGISGGRELLDRNLGLGSLEHSSERHQHCRTSDGTVEHLDESSLGTYVRPTHEGVQTVLQLSGCRLGNERILVFDGSDLGLGEMPCTCAVYEITAEIHDRLAMVEHSHSGRVGHLSDMGDFYILAAAVFREHGFILSLNDNGHTLLGLADSEFGAVQAAVFDRDAVEPDVESVGKFADGDADAAGSEVIGLLYERSHFRPAEQTLELALLRCVTFLHLAAACFQRCLRMFL